LEVAQRIGGHADSRTTKLYDRRAQQVLVEDMERVRYTDQQTMSLAQQAALDDLAQHLYDFPPGKAHPYADQSLSFPGVAKALGLEKYWPGGSKQPAIRSEECVERLSAGPQ